MTSHMGRSRWCRTMVITGNKNGLAGFAMAAAPENKPSITAAKNKAGQRLIYIERYNEHTGKKFYTNLSIIISKIVKSCKNFILFQ